MFALSAVLLALVSVYFLLALVTLGRLTVLLKRGGRDGRGRDKPVAELPCVAVVLPVRGIDPFLHNTLRGLMQQDYPSYEVHVIVDSEEDDAWQFVKERCGITAGDAIHLHVLKSPRATCSLKNSALVQVFKQLKRDCRVVALLDADVIPHPRWLRALVEPLSDERVAVTTGYRWYIPPVRNWGGLVRAIWNAGAMPQLW